MVTANIDGMADITSKQLKWEFMKIKIKEYSIKYSIEKTKDRKKTLSLLRKELESLEENNSLSIEQQARQIEILATLENDLEQKTKGAMLRAKQQDIQFGDKNSKYFLNLEKSRQINNTITSLKTKNGTILETDDEILEEEIKFYSELYRSKGQTNENTTRYLNSINFPRKLDENDNIFLQGNISESECDRVISSLKRDISPGSDGLTTDFYRHFWADIKHFVIDAINESYEVGILPPSFRRIILVLLFKKQDRQLLKYYRPISLSNTDYKILAFILAERLQQVIGKLVGKQQTAYINGRFIGNSARLVLDIFEYFERNETKQHGALLFLDFEKAFDSIEWNFIFETMRKFNFDESFIRWVQLLYENPFVNIKQNGWLSRNVEMQRSCRQGCPVAALAFILCCEVMSLALEQNSEVKGINIGENEYLNSQYADDTTLSLDGKKSIIAALTTIKQFSKFSGLNLNLEKTEAVWLGASKNFAKKFMNITFTEKPVKLLGIHLGYDKAECYKKNWLEKIEKLEKTLDSWKCRKLTLFGKVTVIKSLALPKLIYVASILPVPDDVIKKVNSIIFKFLWDGKDKVRRTIVINSVNEGGLNMTDFESQIHALKAAWIPRLYDKDNNLNQIPYFYFQGIVPTLDILLKMNDLDFPKAKSIPQFYFEVLNAHNKCKSLKNIKTMKDFEILQQPIWGNKLFQINKKPLFLRNWIKSGILYVKDLIIQNSFLNVNLIYQKLINKQNWIAEFYSVTSAFSKIKDKISIEKAKFTNIPRKYKFSLGGTVTPVSHQKSKFFYTILRDKKSEKWYLYRKWEHDFCSNGIDEIVWQNFIETKIKCSEIKIANFNYKIINNILPSKCDLFVFGKVDDYKCNLCQTAYTLKHLFFECTIAKEIWSYIYNCTGVKSSYRRIIVGYNGQDSLTKFINYFLSIVTYIIYKSYLRDLDDTMPHNFINFVKLLKFELLVRKSIFQKRYWNVMSKMI